MIKFALILLIVTVVFPVYGHKLIPSNDDNVSYENSLLIPDHKISWAVYEELDPFQTKFYSFEAKAGEPLYASIVIPKLVGLEKYRPSLSLAGEGIRIENSHNIKAEMPPGGVVVYDYNGQIPSKEFYEPFGQATYWERQEVQISIPEDGTYYLLVFDSQGIKGKYSLAVGTIEDFSPIDFVIILPQAWLATKFFFEDFFSPMILISIFVVIPTLMIIRKKRKKVSLVPNNRP